MAETLIIEHEGKTYALPTDDLAGYQLSDEAVTKLQESEEDVSGFMTRAPRVYIYGPGDVDWGYIDQTPRTPRIR